MQTLFISVNFGENAWIIKRISAFKLTVNCIFVSYDELILYIPNTFTPGTQNRYNNYFRASTIGIEALSINIFNRWGELLYSSNDVDFSWDGTYRNEIVRDGTYIWTIEYVDVHDIEVKQITGHINVIK